MRRVSCATLRLMSANTPYRDVEGVAAMVKQFSQRATRPCSSSLSRQQQSLCELCAEQRDLDRTCLPSIASNDWYQNKPKANETYIHIGLHAPSWQQRREGFTTSTVTKLANTSASPESVMAFGATEGGNKTTSLL